MNTGSVVEVHTAGGGGGGGEGRGGGEQKPILGEASNTNKELTKNMKRGTLQK